MGIKLVFMNLKTNVINRAVFLSLFIFFHSNLLSQTQLSFSFDTIINTGISKSDNVTLFNDESKIFYAKSKINFNKLKLIEEGGTDSIVIACNCFNNRSIKSIDKRFNKIIVTFFRKSFLFERRKYSYYLIDSISHFNTSKASILNNNLLFFYKNYNGTNIENNDTLKTNFALYSIKEKSFIKNKSPNFDFIFYTHLVGNYLSLSPSRSQLIFSQTLPYKIDFYSNELIKEQSIKTEELYQDSLQLTEFIKQNGINENTVFVKNMIKEVKQTDKIINRIIKIYFLNDSTIMVLKKMVEEIKSNKKNRVIDIWQKKDKKWTRLIHNQQYYSGLYTLDNDKKITYHVPFLNSSPFIFLNNSVYFMSDYLPLNKLSHLPEVYEYYKSKDPKSFNKGLIKFNFSFVE